jgi:hypothetical protein
MEVFVCGFHASVRGRRDGRRILGGSISGFVAREERRLRDDWLIF